MGRSTVQAVLATAREQGWIETRRGSGIWASGALPAAAVRSTRRGAAELADLLAGEIRSGSYAVGQDLPSPKALSRKHDLSPATVRKALRSLETRSLVERRGRSWRVGGMARPRTGVRPVLLCLGAPGADGRLRIESDPEWDFWREIQSEAVRSGLEPRLVPWRGQLPEMDDAVVGSVVSNWHMMDSRPLLDQLLRGRRPAAVWVANYEILPGAAYGLARTLWFHDLANGRGAGRTMAEYIGRLPHRHVAWIGPFQGAPWARNRLQGLRESLDPRIRLDVHAGNWTSEWDVQAHVLGDPAVLGKVGWTGDASERDRLARPLVEAVTRDRCLEVFGSHLHEALEGGATLWIAASDLVARWVLHWLRAHGREVPRDLALASFDDTRDASLLDLTSLRFGVQEMARSMIRQVLSAPREPRRLSSYPSHVFERASTAPVP